MAGGMEAEDYLGARGTFDAQALGADGHAAVGADLERRADTPNIRPPRATRGWAQDRTLLLFGEFPGLFRGHAQFAMGFMGVTVESQSVDVWVGDFDLGNLFAGEIGRKPALPELVLALDFALGLRRWSIKEADVVELERPAELSQRVGVFREKHGVIIDVDLQRSAVDEESGGEEIEIGQEEFSAIEFGTDEHAGTIVEHIEHGKVQRAPREPAMGGSIQLPEFADLGALPAAHWGVRAFGRSRMRITILNRPAANLCAVELEGVQAEGFGGGEAVRARRGAMQALFEQVGDRLGPSGGVVTPRGARDPQTLFLSRVGPEVIGGEFVKAVAGQAELFGGFGGRQEVLPEGSQYMPDERRCVAIGQLLILFKRIGSAHRIPTPSPFVGLRYAQASSRTGRGDDP